MTDLLKDKFYLGDGVYAKFDGWQITLTTEDGITTTNTIVLDPEVLKSFAIYTEKLKQQLEQHDNDSP